MEAVGRAVILEHVRAYSSGGRLVFPCRGKIPLTPHGCKDATADAAQLEAWWTRWPDANIGIATGPASGLLVLDVDGEEGEVSLVSLQRRHGRLPDAPWVRTGRGWQLYLSYPDGVRLGNSAGRLGPGIDTRGDGGYVIAPPSLHPSGRRYEWHSRGAPEPTPGWLLRLLSPPPRPAPTNGCPPRFGAGVDAYSRVALELECDRVAGAAEGTRNHTLNAASFSLGTLVGAGLLGQDTVIVALLDAAVASGLSRREAAATIRSGLSAGESHPRTVR